MRAIAVDKLGDAPTLRDVADPTPGPGELLLTVRAAGVNPLDLKAAAGMLDQIGATYRTPLVLGYDVVGRVEALGEGAEGFAVGDEVFGMVLPEVYGHGAYAEQTVVPSSAALTPVPAALGFEVAAMLPMPGGTALRVVDDLDLTQDQTVAIIGAAGAIGTYGTQLAVQAGANVVAVAGGQDRTRLGEHGARWFVDRDDPDVAARIREAAPGGVDAIIDVASDTAGVLALAAAVRAGGTYVSLIQAADVDALAKREIKGANPVYRPEAADVEHLGAMVVEGILQVPPRHLVSLDEAVEALAGIQDGKRKGKFVIVP